MLKFNSLLIGSEKPKELAAFYKKVFVVEPDWEEEEWTGFQVDTGHIAIGPHDKVKGKSSNPERMMFNLETTDVKGEFKRIKSLGAQVIAEPYSMKEHSNFWAATFADPDGNYFQLMSPFEK